MQERPHENLIAWETIQAAFPEYKYTLRNEEREDEVLNLAILSKYPLSESEETYYTDTYNKSMAANVSAPKRKFRLHNTHLQTTQHTFTRFIENAQRRNAQADQLKAQINSSGIPTLVCGDFNDTPCSYTYRKLSFGMQDAFLKASEQWTGSFQPMGRWLRIDYILCSPDWQVQAYQLIENPWSDHKMQLATLNY
jgi:endonuclease/exonuclease/phosphatase (EEP) superfamily protein YafD